jgi:hypothetical protein
MATSANDHPTLNTRGENFRRRKSPEKGRKQSPAASNGANSVQVPSVNGGDVRSKVADVCD